RCGSRARALCPTAMPPDRDRTSASGPLHGLQARGLDYGVGISTTMSAHPRDAAPVTEPYSGNGRPPVAKYPDKAQSVKAGRGRRTQSSEAGAMA
ncbi:transposase, partial [Streptomyces sp. NPDC060198]|uniref:transposase n=1 Tax=Streptomyces sp. NPDC060198 TaxID=3347070 RepID=UPI00365DF41B